MKQIRSEPRDTQINDFTYSYCTLYFQLNTYNIMYTHNQIKFKSLCGLKVGEIVHIGSLATGTALPGRFDASLVVYSSGKPGSKYITYPHLSVTVCHPLI